MAETKKETAIKKFPLNLSPVKPTTMKVNFNISHTGFHSYICLSNHLPAVSVYKLYLPVFYISTLIHICKLIPKYIYIFVKLQLGFSPVAVVQQYNKQVTYITHKQSTNTIQQHNNK
jgi:hypothetical protein